MCRLLLFQDRWLKMVKRMQHGCMRPSIFAHALEVAERRRLEARLRSLPVLVLRRCQILVASTRGPPARKTAELVSYHDQNVRNLVAAFHAPGLDFLRRPSCRRSRMQAVVDDQAKEKSRDLVRRGRRADHWLGTGCPLSPQPPSRIRQHVWSLAQEPRWPKVPRARPRLPQHPASAIH
jgi:hypothetical protein